jgi:DNA-binding MarR family transcriptional regulator
MALVAAGREVERGLEAGLARHGLSLRLVGALGHLRAGPGTSYSELARRSGVTVQSMHATVGRLVELGAVVSSDAGRGTAASLEVTEEGRRLLALAGEVAAEVDEGLPEAVAEAGVLLLSEMRPPGAR